MSMYCHMYLHGKANDDENDYFGNNLDPKLVERIYIDILIGQ
jgi:hypothetical protein